MTRAKATTKTTTFLTKKKAKCEKLWTLTKWYYGPRADRLQGTGDLAQLLLSFAEEMDRKAVHPEDVTSPSEPQEELRRVKRRKGRRNLANFENLPVTTQVYELSPEQRACPCCGVERKEIGADESWQIEYYPGHFERLHHVRKKYACPACEHNGDNPRMETATKPETAIEKGMAGPGLVRMFSPAKASKSRAPHNRFGAATWRICSSRCGN